MKNQIFRVHKENIYQVDHCETELADLQAGAIRLKIDKYAFTSNNITYAVIGHQLQYWNFYPTEEPFGIIPVWGYADVVASKHQGIKAGDRFYGYYPMSSYCTLIPGNVNALGFSENAAHRRELAPVYNNYTRVATSPAEPLEDYVPIFKPLFATSFLIYQLLKAQYFSETEQILLTSASSKTSLALAAMLKKNQANDGKKIIGLTSARNLDFVKSTNYHDEVFAYENYKDIATKKTVIVDISGNHKLLKNLSDYLNDQLGHIIMVGLTDWKSSNMASNLPKSEFFFAPTQFKVFYKLHGAEKAGKILDEALMDFIQVIKEKIVLERITDVAQLSRLYLEMVDGKVDPGRAYLVEGA